MKNIYFKLLVVLYVLTTSNFVFAQETSESKCVEGYQNLIKSMKSNEGQFDANVNKFYNLFYYGINTGASTPNGVKNFFTKGCSYQIDENSGLVFLITESQPEAWSKTLTYYLNAFHPIIGPFQFYFDEENGQYFLPKQNKKVSVTSRNYSTDYGFTLVVSIDKEYNTITTEIEDKYNRCCNQPSLAFLYDKEFALKGVKDYPIESNLNSYYGTMRVLDLNKTQEVEVKYVPSYEEKLSIYRTGGLPKQDLENPNFYILKKQRKEVYKNEVYGRKGSRHFLNDCFEELESSYSNYFIYKRGGKYGILDASWESLKNNKHLITNNIYDKVTWNQGTETFTVVRNNETSVIDLKSKLSENKVPQTNSANTQANSPSKVHDGIQETRRKDGDLESRIEYKDGVQNGIYERYYMGKLEIKGEMKSGKQHGRWEFYIDESGKYLNGKVDKKQSGIYEDGKKIKNL